MQFNWKNKIMRILLTQNILTICLFLDILTNQIKRKTLKSGFQFTLIQYSFKILQLIKCIKTVRPIRRCWWNYDEIAVASGTVIFIRPFWSTTFRSHKCNLPIRFSFSFYSEVFGTLLAFDWNTRFVHMYVSHHSSKQKVKQLSLWLASTTLRLCGEYTN